MHTEFWCGNLT